MTQIPPTAPAPGAPQGPAPVAASPQAMRLRTGPPSVTRVSRKVIAAGAGAAALLVCGLGYVALTAPHSKAEKTPALNPAQKPNLADGLANMPKDYSAAAAAAASATATATATALPSQGPPQLGPPLPGDLGRPILKAQEAAAGGGVTASGAAAPALSPAEQLQAQERDAARTSKLFTAQSLAGGGQTAAAPGALPLPGASGGGAAASPAPAVSNDAVVTENLQDRKTAFQNGEADHHTESAERLTAPASPYVVQAGAVIAAALVTGVNSDLPGQITAQVTQAVYDSPSGRFLLIPQGARLIGVYDSQVAFGQSRAQMVWTRLILPNGRSLVLERAPGADPQGFAGLSDQVDHHWRGLFTAALLSTVLSVGTEAGEGPNNNGLAQAFRQGAGQTFNQAGEEVVRRQLNIQPTLTIRPGFPVRVIVNRDLMLEPYAE